MLTADELMAHRASLLIAMPTLGPAFSAMASNASRPAGCRGCRGGAVKNALISKFMQHLFALTDKSGVVELLGKDRKLLVNGIPYTLGEIEAGLAAQGHTADRTRPPRSHQAVKDTARMEAYDAFLAELDEVIAGTRTIGGLGLYNYPVTARIRERLIFVEAALLKEGREDADVKAFMADKIRMAQEQIRSNMPWIREKTDPSRPVSSAPAST